MLLGEKEAEREREGGRERRIKTKAVFVGKCGDREARGRQVEVGDRGARDGERETG